MHITKFVMEETGEPPRLFNICCLNLPGRWDVHACTIHFKSRTAFLLVEPVVNQVVRLRLVGIFKIDAKNRTCCMVDTGLLAVSHRFVGGVPYIHMQYAR